MSREERGGESPPRGDSIRAHVRRGGGRGGGGVERGVEGSDARVPALARRRVGRTRRRARHDGIGQDALDSKRGVGRARRQVSGGRGRRASAVTLRRRGRTRRRARARARRAFRALDIKWPLAASAMDAGGAAAELAAIRDARLLLPDEFLRVDEGREGDEKEKTQKKNIVPANAEDDDGPCGGCFGISVSRGFGATGLRASLRDALFASVRDDALDASASEALSAKARAAVAAADAAAAAVGGSLPFRTLGTSTNAGADDGEGEETAAAAEAKAVAALRADFFSPLADVSPGVTDVLHYASQLTPGISRETRLWARSELALVAVSDLALSAVIAGRPTPAARALVAHARAFCARRTRAPSTPLFSLNLAAAMCPQGRRASALDRAAGVLETEARRLRRGA